MLTIGLLREGKIPEDNRVALTPFQCKWIKENFEVDILLQTSNNRCFTDDEYLKNGISVVDDLNECSIILGIKEVPIEMLLANKTYLFFSHTKKMQPHNKKLLQAIIQKQITLIDYECLEHIDGQRIIGFGFFAGIVGAHNGIWAYGNRHNLFTLPRVFECKDYTTLIRYYFGLNIPPIKIAVTGGGRVANGVIEIMNLMGIIEVEPEDYLQKKYTYPVYTQLKGADLYTHKELNTYKRDHFHQNPTEYKSLFAPYIACTDILMNGVFWDNDMPRLFEKIAVNTNFNIQTIVDITDDEGGSIPINLGDQTIENPIYGVNKINHTKTASYSAESVDIIAVGNLPNELPRDASTYFGEQLIKYIIPGLLSNGNDIIDRATMVKNGQLTERFSYLKEYVEF